MIFQYPVCWQGLMVSYMSEFCSVANPNSEVNYFACTRSIFVFHSCMRLIPQVHASNNASAIIAASAIKRAGCLRCMFTNMNIMNMNMNANVNADTNMNTNTDEHRHEHEHD